MADTKSADLATAYDDWMARAEEEFQNAHKENEWQNFEDERQNIERVVSVMGHLRRDVLKRATAEGWSGRDLAHHLLLLKRNLCRLDETVHSRIFRSRILDDRCLWRHLDFAAVYRETVKEDRDNFRRQLPELREFILPQYLANPALHYPYLDWLVMDIVTAGYLIDQMEAELQRRHGPAYTAFGLVGWKLLLFKSICYPTMWALNCAGPGLFAWWISGYSLVAALVVAALLYGWNIFNLIYRMIIKVKVALSGQPSTVTVLAAQGVAYEALRGPILHVQTVRAAFDRVTAKGTIWNQEALCILDRLASNPPTVWTTH